MARIAVLNRRCGHLLANPWTPFQQHLPALPSILSVLCRPNSGAAAGCRIGGQVDSGHGPFRSDGRTGHGREPPTGTRSASTVGPGAPGRRVSAGRHGCSPVRIALIHEGRFIRRALESPILPSWSGRLPRTVAEIKALLVAQRAAVVAGLPGEFFRLDEQNACAILRLYRP